MFFPGNQDKAFDENFWTIVLEPTMKSWCYDFPCRFQTGQLSFEVIFIDSVC